MGYEEIWAPEIYEFLTVADKAYCRNDVLTLEKAMLNSLGFQLTIPTAYLFLQRFLKLAKASVDVYMLSEYLVELALLDYQMLELPCSQIAAAALYSANKSLNMPECWDYTMKQYTSYDVDDLATCILAIAKLREEAPTSCLQAAFKKFMGTRFNGVVSMQINERIMVA